MHLMRSLPVSPALSRRFFPKAKPSFTCISPSRAFLLTSSRRAAKNQVYASVRNSDQFHNYQLISSSSRTPLLTLWTTSWCPTCRTVEPLLRHLVESGVGETEGGVGYCTVECDAPDIMEASLGLTYVINSLPTLLSFDAQEAQVETKVTNGRQLSDRKFLENWIRTEAKRHGDRGGGGPGIGNPLHIFSGLFSNSN
ncbi:hypothetical protein B0T25DRAFT_52535 [Lasiosphaeria hispida]|uniref:Thioredoxin domain-containing protein n=1 Tax=Lasiosphaeria hispida TaxID=260671 RepID=A0AAJ0MKC8_9PEZI|nr:hypothetical protein B0T25DRAFT_52535 [Lasiosphaeria hispida]